jgi:hypothetical protein
VEKVEGLTIDRFVAADGQEIAGGRPAGGAQEPGRGAARSSGALAWEAGAVVLGRLGRPWRTARRHWTAAKSARGGGGARERAGRTGSAPRVQRRARAGRPAAFKGGRDSGRWLQECCGAGRLPRSACVDLGRCAWQEDRRRTAGSSATVVRCGKYGSCSKDGRREGDHGPDVEAVGTSLTHAETDVTAGARRAAQTTAAGCPARRRRFGARSSSFSAGQRVFDCVFLQKVE